jgi:hypothetical protein
MEAERRGQVGSSQSRQQVKGEERITDCFVMLCWKVELTQQSMHSIAAAAAAAAQQQPNRPHHVPSLLRAAHACHELAVELVGPAPAGELAAAAARGGQRGTRTKALPWVAAVASRDAACKQQPGSSQAAGREQQPAEGLCCAALLLAALTACTTLLQRQGGSTAGGRECGVKWRVGKSAG